jgi:hypothetical protein
MNYHIQSLFRFNIPFTFHWRLSYRPLLKAVVFFQFFDANYGGQEYDALDMRGGEEVGSATKPPSRVCPTSYSMVSNSLPIFASPATDIDRKLAKKQTTL